MPPPPPMRNAIVYYFSQALQSLFCVTIRARPTTRILGNALCQPNLRRWCLPWKQVKAAADDQQLVEFLEHGNTQIRQVAAEHLVGYSSSQLSIFKSNQLKPVKDLKLLVKDYEPIAKNALTILINISEDAEVRQSLVKDDDFVETLLRKVTAEAEPNADLICMLLANLSKADEATKLLTLSRAVPKPLSISSTAIDQLLDCFVKGSEGSYNSKANYDYLSYLVADLSKHSEGRRHFLTARKDDNDIVPLTKLIVFTEHKSTIRRRGVANTIKNAAFDVDAHSRMLEAQSEGGIDLLPYIILPLMGSEEYSDEDTEGMLDEVQLLPPDKQRDPQNDILCTHLDTLLLLTTTREGRDRLRSVKVYPIIRELHLKVEDEGVREACDRLVQVLMRDEAGDEASRVQEVDEDEQIVEIF